MVWAKPNKTIGTFLNHVRTVGVRLNPQNHCIPPIMIFHGTSDRLENLFRSYNSKSVI